MSDSHVHTWLTIDEARERLIKRGITVTSRQGVGPPSRQTIMAWIRKELLRAHLIGGGGPGKRGLWMVDPAAVETFVPPQQAGRRGRPRDPMPSEMAMYQRNYRAKRAKKPNSVTDDKNDHHE